MTDIKVHVIRIQCWIIWRITLNKNKSICLVYKSNTEIKKKKFKKIKVKVNFLDLRFSS